MLKIYKTENLNLYEKVRALLAPHGDTRILFTANGKPYVENGAFFSITHSGQNALIAICDSPVGIDTEQKRMKNYNAVLSRFPENERREIAGTDDFLRHWVVREAYIKMLGATLAEKLNKLTFSGGTLYDNGERVKCNVICGETDGMVFCVCTDNERNFEILKFD